MKDSADILIAESSRDDADLIILVFMENNLRASVKVVFDGREALDYVFCRGDYSQRDIAAMPGLIFLDLRLPVVGGLDVLSQLRSDVRTRAIPVVILTTSREERDSLQTYALGDNTYIAKEVAYEEFAGDVVDVVRRRLVL